MCAICIDCGCEIRTGELYIELREGPLHLDCAVGEEEINLRETLQVLSDDLYDAKHDLAKANREIMRLRADLEAAYDMISRQGTRLAYKETSTGGINYDLV